MNLKKAEESDEIHLVKECMVFALGSNSHIINAHPIVIWPTCSKDEIEIQMGLIQGLSDESLKRNGAPLLCWATDGDPTRRQIFDNLMKYEMEESLDIYTIISRLRFMDTKVGKHEDCGL